MAPPFIRVPLPQLGFIQDSFSLARFSGNRLLLRSAVSASPSLLRCPSCRCRNSSTLARPFSDRMGERKTPVTVRPSRLRLWNVPITFELLTFPRSVLQCPQSPSLRQSNVTSSYSSPHLSRRHRVRWPLLLPPSLLMDGVETASVAIVTSFRSPSRKGGERGRLLIGRPLQSGFAVPPLSLWSRR